MKKLLITTDCFLPRWDGVARFLSELLPSLKNHFDVTVIAPKFQGKFQKIHGVKIIRMPLMRLRFGDIYFSWFNFKEVRKHAEKADIIFNQTIGPIGISSILAASKLKKPVISYVHSIEWELTAKAMKRFKNEIWHAVRWMARKLYNKCSLLILPSKIVEDILTENKITAKKKVVKLGINTDKFNPPVSKALAKKKLKINPEKIIIGFSGRIGREKDIPTLVNAFRKLEKKNKNVQLLIVGEGIDEQLKGENIILPGSVNNVNDYLKAMDIFVLPSLTETSSLATMEAMATGLPVIVTPVGSIPEYVVHNKNGLVFSRGDVSALYRYLKRLVHDETLRAKLGNEARKTIIKDHKWSETAKEIINVMKNF